MLPIINKDDFEEKLRTELQVELNVTRQKGNILSLDGIPYGTFLEN